VRVIFAIRSAALVVALLSFLAPRDASAERAPEEALAEARRQLDHQDYRRVLRVVGPLAQDEGAPLRVRLPALELTGVAQLLLRNQDEAQAAFEALLRLDPGYELSDPSYPPRISEFLDMVRQSLDPTADVALSLDGELAPVLAGGEPLEVRVRLGEGRGRVDRVVLLVRSGGDDDYREMPMECDATRSHCTLTVETPETGGQLEIYAEARSPSGARLGGMATATEPLAVALEVAEPGTSGGGEPITVPPERTPWHSTWWFWTVVGVGAAAVIAGSVTAGVLLYEPPEPEPGTMGYARLP
jgi:hypothetical protein